MQVRRALILGGLLGCGYASMLVAEDAVKVDPKHYTVVSENDQVRILRVHYGPHEKSIMHSHPASVAVFLNDGKARFTDASGKTQDVTMKAGQVQGAPAEVQNPEKTGDN